MPRGRDCVSEEEEVKKGGSSGSKNLASSASLYARDSNCELSVKLWTLSP